jgi:PAS domain S-box-containing protein
MDNEESENGIKKDESDPNYSYSKVLSRYSSKEISFRKAIENAIPSGIAVIDDTGRQIYTNKSFCKMVGWEEEELVDKYPPYQYWSKEDSVNINRALKQTLDNNVPKEGFDLLFCNKSGENLHVNVMLSPFVQDDKKIFWVANVIDITERKKEESILKKSQLLLTSSIESLRDTIIFSIDLDYRYLLFNKAHIQAMKFAYDKDVSFGMNFLDCISKDDDRRLLKENLDKAFRGEYPSIIQTFGEVNRDYYEVFFNPIVNENNEISGCTCLARNISERKNAEIAIIESETKLKEIINQINDGIIVFDEQEKIIIWNKGAEQICGITADSILDKSIVDLYFQVVPKPLQDKALIKKNIKDITTMQKPEIFDQIIDDEIIPLNSHSMRDTQRRVFPIKLNGSYLFCMVFRDVTEIKRYEKELVRISAEKDRFYSAIARYMYTPVNTFYNFTTVMAVQMDSLPIKEIQKMAVMMGKSATNLYNLLDNLLQWTKMNQGKITFNPENLNFIKTSQDALTILKPNANLKNIKINNNVEDEISIFADLFMIKTILRNLVMNAIKFTDEDGEIVISLNQTPEHVVISIMDNGTGLSPESLKKIFATSEIHTALDSAEEKGTTLGLLLCKEFVEKHGGVIWVESVKDKGCNVKFTLPVK